MNFMEAIRLLQFSVDQLRADVQEVKTRQEIISRDLSTGMKHVHSFDSRGTQSSRSINGMGLNLTGGMQGNTAGECSDSEGSVVRSRPSVSDQSVSRTKPDEQVEILGKSQTREQEVMIYGDSRVRFMNRAFCERKRDSRMRVCLPGAKLKDLSDNFDDVVRGSSRGSVLILHGGVNDVGNTLSEELIDTYRTVIAKLVKSGRKGIITGILPKFGAGTEWSSRAIGINERVKRLCKESNMQFLDYWANFWGKRELYSIDGYHLSRKGVLFLSDLYEKELQQGN